VREGATLESARGDASDEEGPGLSRIQGVLADCRRATREGNEGTALDRCADLALQSAHCVRTYGELPLPNLVELLKITEIGQKELELLRDGTEALVGVLATVTNGLEDEPKNPVQ
jgi:hypothetical protein